MLADLKITNNFGFNDFRQTVAIRILTLALYFFLGAISYEHRSPDVYLLSSEISKLILTNEQ